LLLVFICSFAVNAQFQFDGFWEIQNYYVKISKSGKTTYDGVAVKKKKGYYPAVFEDQAHFTMEISKSYEASWSYTDYGKNGKIQNSDISLKKSMPDEFRLKGALGLTMGKFIRIDPPQGEQVSVDPRINKIFEEVNETCSTMTENHFYENKNVGLEGLWSESSNSGFHQSEIGIAFNGKEYHTCTLENFNFAFGSASSSNRSSNYKPFSTLLKLKPTAIHGLFLVEFYIKELGQYIGGKARLNGSNTISYSVTFSPELIDFAGRISSTLDTNYNS